ncbi:MAG TPA: hypothetical protein VNJ11_11125, partial [Bryobacteraceae bacterium]|nr:hypothetical protein [Bryobacteraceae bacterium]
MEEPLCFHSAPFGNWGVDSNYGTRVDGDQFQGWHYGDGHHQWNSCTYFYPCPDSSCRYCNYPWPSCTDQKTIGAVNTHGSKYVDVWVSCPVDTDGDGDCDQGGCKDVWAYGENNNWVRLFELDFDIFWCHADDYVDTLYFPPTEVNLFCEPGYC